MTDLRAALVAIQELHKPVKGWISEREYLLYCADCGDATYPCKTRKLADEALNSKPKSAIRRQCPNCKGVGKITYAGQIMPGRDFYTKKCLTCGGTGRMARTNQGENNE